MAVTVTPSLQCIGKLAVTEPRAGVCILRLEESQRLVMAVLVKAFHEVHCLHVLDLTVPVRVCHVVQVWVLPFGLFLALHVLMFLLVLDQVKSGVPSRRVPSHGVPSRGVPSRGVPSRGVAHYTGTTRRVAVGASTAVPRTRPFVAAAVPDCTRTVRTHMMAVTITPSLQCIGKLAVTEPPAGVCIFRLEESQRLVMAVLVKAFHEVHCLHVLDLTVPVHVCHVMQVWVLPFGLLLALHVLMFLFVLDQVKSGVPSRGVPSRGVAHYTWTTRRVAVGASTTVPRTRPFVAAAVPDCTRTVRTHMMAV